MGRGLNAIAHAQICSVPAARQGKDAERAPTPSTQTLSLVPLPSRGPLIASPSLSV